MWADFNLFKNLEYNECIAKVLVDQNKMEEYWGADWNLLKLGIIMDVLSFCLSLNFIKDTRYRIVYIAI